MSQKEAIRAQVMELLTADKIDQKEAGKRQLVSIRSSWKFTMINTYTVSNGRLSKTHLDAQGDLRLNHPIWIDVVAPNDEERKWIEQAYHLILLKPEQLRDIEASARFYEYNDELHLCSDFLLGKGSNSRSVAVAFVLSGNIFFSVHEEDLPVFYQRHLTNRGQPDYVEDCKDVLIDLYSMNVELSADAMEGVYADLGQVSSKVLNAKLSDKLLPPY